MGGTAPASPLTRGTAEDNFTAYADDLWRRFSEGVDAVRAELADMDAMEPRAHHATNFVEPDPTLTRVYPLALDVDEGRLRFEWEEVGVHE